MALMELARLAERPVALTCRLISGVSTWSLVDLREAASALETSGSKQILIPQQLLCTDTIVFIVHAKVSRRREVQSYSHVYPSDDLLSSLGDCSQTTPTQRSTTPLPFLDRSTVVRRITAIAGLPHTGSRPHCVLFQHR